MRSSLFWRRRHSGSATVKEPPDSVAAGDWQRGGAHAPDAFEVGSVAES